MQGATILKCPWHIIWPVFVFRMDMEHRETYKKLASIIKDLEHQLSLCDRKFQEYEISGTDAKKEIEEHFSDRINEIVARKETLLAEVDNNITNQSMLCLLPRLCPSKNLPILTFHSLIIPYNRIPSHFPPTFIILPSYSSLPFPPACYHVIYCSYIPGIFLFSSTLYYIFFLL